MTLDEEFAKYQGQSLLVPGGLEADRGQCVQWADYVLRDVYGLSYVWANAIDWWNLPGSLGGTFQQITDGSIKKGDFVIFNQKVGSVYGHIDVAMADGTIDNFTGADSNWGGNKTVHLVNHVGRQYVIGSLRLKGNTMSDAEREDYNKWKAIGQALSFLPTYKAMGGTPGNPDADPKQVQLVVDDLEKNKAERILLQQERDNVLYPYVNAVSAVLGIPNDASKLTTVTDAIKNAGAKLSQTQVIKWIQENTK